ncbi:GDP-L-fucose synthase family protein [Kordiimonas sp.]|uniref:GDP-L-fucose synthase family protein n=1 Tax=Kordiimonas sp. TaxID=1970157 RepID=UPI003A934FD6
MEKNSKIYVAGHRGMVGSAIVRGLLRQGFSNIVTRSHAELALDVQAEADSFFAESGIDYVFLAAAKVGGIAANMAQGGDFIRQNLLIQTNVIDAAYRAGVKKLLLLGSSCIYPREAAQPMREDALLTGPLETTNLPYAVAKIAGKVMCDAYRQQYDFKAFTAMPSNVYGINDNFHPENAHLVAGMMQRFHKAKKEGAQGVTVWGTGTPLRELIYADDLADGCIFLMNHYDDGGLVNVGSGEEVSVRDLAQRIKKTVGFEGRLTFDTDKPDGTPRKIMDNSKINTLGWRANTGLDEGLAQMYAAYLSTLTV